MSDFSNLFIYTIFIIFSILLHVYLICCLFCSVLHCLALLNTIVIAFSFCFALVLAIFKTYYYSNFAILDNELHVRSSSV